MPTFLKKLQRYFKKKEDKLELKRSLTDYQVTQHEYKSKTVELSSPKIVEFDELPLERTQSLDSIVKKGRFTMTTEKSSLYYANIKKDKSRFQFVAVDTLQDIPPLKEEFIQRKSVEKKQEIVIEKKSVELKPVKNQKKSRFQVVKDDTVFMWPLIVWNKNFNQKRDPI